MSSPTRNFDITGQAQGQPLHGVEYSLSRFQLAQGLRVVCVEQTHLHQVSIAFYVRTGSRYERPEENGISHFLEHMLFRGTALHPTAFDLNFAVESIGGTLYAATAPDSTVYEITLPVDQLENGLRLLAEVACGPRLREIDIERRVIAEEIKEDLDEHGNWVEIDYLSRRRLWAGHPLGQSVIGSVENANRFDEKQLRDWYEQNYTAKNAVLCLTGSLGADGVRPIIERYWSALPSGAPHDEQISPARAPGPSYQHVHKTGSQTAVRLAFHAPGHLHRDFVPFSVLLGVFDDGMSTRLHRRIFDELGLAYNVSADLDVYDDVGALNVDALCGHENVIECTAEMLHLLEELKSEISGPKSEELAKTQNRAVWALESLCDDPHGMSAWFGEQALYEEPGLLELRAGEIRAVTGEMLLEVARRYLMRGGLHVTTVGVLDPDQQAEMERLVHRFGSGREK